MCGEGNSFRVSNNEDDIDGDEDHLDACKSESNETVLINMSHENEFISNGPVEVIVDTGRKLDVHKTFRRRPGRLLNVLFTSNLRPVSTGYLLQTIHLQRAESSPLVSIRKTWISSQKTNTSFTNQVLQSAIKLYSKVFI